MISRTSKILKTLKVCDDGILIQLLCFWTLSIVLSQMVYATLGLYCLSCVGASIWK
jgi:hypothetical protein